MILLLALLLLADPTFADYPSPADFQGTPAKPVLKTPAQKQSRTMSTDGAKKGPNFAGHFTIAQWGCGSGCVSIAVVDAKTGTVYDGPFKVLTSSPLAGPELDFQVRSRLLIARGCPEETNCGPHFYEWTGKQFKPIK